MQSLRRGARLLNGKEVHLRLAVALWFCGALAELLADVSRSKIIAFRRQMDLGNLQQFLTCFVMILEALETFCWQYLNFTIRVFNADARSPSSSMGNHRALRGRGMVLQCVICGVSARDLPVALTSGGRQV